jgi:hypothetical protein
MQIAEGVVFLPIQQHFMLIGTFEIRLRRGLWYERQFVQFALIVPRTGNSEFCLLPFTF